MAWSEEDARDFCRNHLFVDRLEWIRDPGSSAPADVVAAPLPSAAPAGSVVPSAPVEPAPSTNGPILAIIVAIAALVLGSAVGAIGIRRRRA